jgi:serine/threonine-protein kinase
VIGTTIGNFRIVSQLGKGGMGEVWLAEQQSIKTKVAIKLLRPDVSADVSHVQRFFNEAVAVSKIRHAGITKIFDVGFLGTQAYLVMELLEGETLTRRIARAGRLPLWEVCDIGRQVAGVLDATHAAHIIHRDFKPDNVFLVQDAELPSGERAKVLDFGIAKLGSVGITATSVGSMGTPLYMSPEQWRSVAKVDGRTDAYSLGCVVFEMACGRPPFLADSMGEACAKHLTEAPPVASSLVPELPPAFDQVVAGLLEKDPAQRPSMKEVMATLAAIASRLPPPSPAHGGGASARLPTAPVLSGAPTVATQHGAAAQQGVAETEPAASPAPTVTTLGGAAGSAPATGARRGRRAGWMILGAVVAAAGATAGVLAVRAREAPGESAGSQAATPAPATIPAPAPEPADPVPPAPADPVPPAPDPALPPPPPKAAAPFVSPTAVRRLAGDSPKDLRFPVAAQLCIDPAGAVTSVEVGLDVDPKVATEVKKKLETWRYAPFRRTGAAIAVCFQTTLRAKRPDLPLPGSGSAKPGSGSGELPGSGSGEPSGSGSSSGNGKPPGSGSGKPPGSGSGKPPGSGSSKPPGSGSSKAPGSGSSKAPGSGSGKPPGSGSGSGANSGNPPGPPMPEQLGRAEFMSVMKSVEPSLRECRRPPKGLVPVAVQIAPDGSVGGVKVNAKLKDAPVGCIRRKVSAAKFPATKLGGAFVYELKP